MTDWVYRTIIVPDTLVQYARDLTAVAVGPAGQGMYTTELVRSSDPNTTLYWISAGLISQELALLLPLTTQTTDGIVIEQGNSEAVVRLASEAGFETSIEQVNELFSKSYVSEQEPHSYISSLGLSIKVSE